MVTASPSYSCFDNIWLWHDAYPLQEQGWKIHLSCYEHNYERLQYQVLDLLKDYTFKKAADSTIVSRLNAGKFGKQITGKAITIYINSHHALIPLLEALLPLVTDLEGPVIPDEWCYRSSVIYFRYCWFGEALRELPPPIVPEHETTIHQLLASCITGRQQLQQYLQQVATQTGENIIPLRCIKIFPRIVYQVRIGNRKYVLKMLASYDPVLLNRFHNETRIQYIMAGKVNIPPMRHHGRIADISFLIASWRKGDSLAVIRKKVATNKDFLPMLTRNLRNDLRCFTKQGIGPADINLQNVLINDASCCFIDLDEYTFDTAIAGSCNIHEMAATVTIPLRTGMALHLLQPSQAISALQPVHINHTTFFTTEVEAVFDVAYAQLEAVANGTGFTNSRYADLLMYIVLHPQLLQSKTPAHIFTHALHEVASYKHGGIYNSSLGLMVPLLYYARDTGNTLMQQQCAALLIQLFPLVTANSSFTVHSGLAGIGCLYMGAAGITNDSMLHTMTAQLFTGMIVPALQEIRDAAQTSAHGMLHGWCGMLDVCLRYNVKYQQHIISAEQLKYFRSKMQKLVKSSHINTSWCNGTTGIAACFTSLYRYTQATADRRYALKMLQQSTYTVYEQTGICHGYAAWVEAARQLEDISTLKSYHKRLCLAYYHMNQNFLQWQQHHIHTLSLLHGKTGVLTVILNGGAASHYRKTSPYLHTSLL